jgi:glutamate-1-semialdehyde aminotransferase
LLTEHRGLSIRWFVDWRIPVHDVNNNAVAHVLFERQHAAEEYLPGGVGGSARFNPALGYALAISRAQGSRIYDVTGKDYIDFNLAHGAAFLRLCAGKGVYFHSYGALASGHHGFSAAHSHEDIDEALNRIEGALREF